MKTDDTGNSLSFRYCLPCAWYIYPIDFSRCSCNNSILFGLRSNVSAVVWRKPNAKSLLQSSDMSIAEVAEKVGVKSASHFSKIFENEVGESPSKFRKSYFDRNHS